MSNFAQEWHAFRDALLRHDPGQDTGLACRAFYAGAVAAFWLLRGAVKDAAHRRENVDHLQDELRDYDNPPRSATIHRLHRMH